MDGAERPQGAPAKPEPTGEARRSRPRGRRPAGGFFAFRERRRFLRELRTKNHRPAGNAGEEDTMIKITQDFPCIHCGLCAEACSHGVIKMVPDEEGRLIPKVAFSSCRYCRACRRACPVIPAEEV